MKKRSVFKYIIVIIINYSIAVFLSLAISYWFSYNLKDVLFILGLFALIIGIISNISGNSHGLSLQSLGNNNAQYVANVDFKANGHENIEHRLVVNLKAIMTSAFLISSILSLITAYFLWFGLLINLLYNKIRVLSGGKRWLWEVKN